MHQVVPVAQGRTPCRGHQRHGGVELLVPCRVRRFITRGPSALPFPSTLLVFCCRSLHLYPHAHVHCGCKVVTTGAASTASRFPVVFAVVSRSHCRRNALVVCMLPPLPPAVPFIVDGDCATQLRPHVRARRVPVRPNDRGVVLVHRPPGHRPRHDAHAAVRVPQVPGDVGHGGQGVRVRGPGRHERCTGQGRGRVRRHRRHRGGRT